MGDSTFIQKNEKKCLKVKRLVLEQMFFQFSKYAFLSRSIFTEEGVIWWKSWIYYQLYVCVCVCVCVCISCKGQNLTLRDWVQYCLCFLIYTLHTLSDTQSASTWAVIQVWSTEARTWRYLSMNLMIRRTCIPS